METIKALDSITLPVLCSELGNMITQKPTARQLWAIQQSLAFALDTEMSTETLLELSRKVLENKSFIMEGFPIPSWDGGQITVQIGIKHTSEHKSKAGTIVDLECRALTNLVAGQLFSYSTTINFAHKMFKKDMGMKDLEYLFNPRYFTGMVLSVHMSKTEDGYIKFHKIWCTEKQKLFNKELLNARYERAGCGKSNPGPCWRCSRKRSECQCGIR